MGVEYSYIKEMGLACCVNLSVIKKNVAFYLSKIPLRYRMIFFFDSVKIFWHVGSLRQTRRPKPVELNHVLEICTVKPCYKES